MAGAGGARAPPAPPAVAVTPTPALPDIVPMHCAISGCDFNAHGRKPMVAPCPCEHIVCHKCLVAWAGMPGPGPCLACRSRSVAPFEAEGCRPATGVLVVLVTQLPQDHMYVRWCCAGAHAWGAVRGATCG